MMPGRDGSRRRAGRGGVAPGRTPATAAVADPPRRPVRLSPSSGARSRHLHRARRGLRDDRHGRSRARRCGLLPSEAARLTCNRDFSIGRLSVRLLTGTFIVENLRIGGLTKSDRPFLTAKSIDVSMSFSALLHREVLVDSVVMHDWDMLVEKWSERPPQLPEVHARHRQAERPEAFRHDGVVRAGGPRPVHLRRSRNAAAASSRATSRSSLRRPGGYGGTARFSTARSRFSKYLPMRADMQGWFTIDGGTGEVQRLDLVSDGAKTEGHRGRRTWTTSPSRRGTCVSRVNFPRMKRDVLREGTVAVTGDGDFVGVFHLFKGGRDLHGDFTAKRPVNGIQVPAS